MCLKAITNPHQYGSFIPKRMTDFTNLHLILCLMCFSLFLLFKLSFHLTLCYENPPPGLICKIANTLELNLLEAADDV